VRSILQPKQENFINGWVFTNFSFHSWIVYFFNDFFIYYYPDGYSYLLGVYYNFQKQALHIAWALHFVHSKKTSYKDKMLQFEQTY
jgi:hypothetical protein